MLPKVIKKKLGQELQNNQEQRMFQFRRYRKHLYRVFVKKSDVFKLLVDGQQD